MHELLVFGMFYVIALAVHSLHKHYKAHAARKAKAKEDADALNVLSPMHVPLAPHKRHVIAVIAAAVAHPATAESIHHYVVHFLVYSGTIIK